MLAAGCGFQPIYEWKAKHHPAADLANIEIAIIKDRIGQQLRNFLLDQINPMGTPVSPNYTLKVSLRQTKQNLALKKSQLSTRASLTFDSKFDLIGKNENLGKGFSGSSQIIVSYNILSSQFPTLVAENNAKTRAVKELSADISNRIAAFLKSSRK